MLSRIIEPPQPDFSHLKHPCSWAAQRQREYEIAALSERYQDVLRASPIAPVGHGLTGQLRGGASPLTPIAIVQAAGLTVLSYVIADLGIDSSPVAAWQDLVAPTTWANATGAQRPIWSTGPGARAAVTADGSDDWLLCGADVVPSNSLGIFWFGVWRLDAWVSGRQLCGGFPGLVACVTSSPQVRRAITSNGPATNMDVGLWHRIYSASQNTTADYLKVGSGAAATGVNLGGSDPSASALFASTSGTNPAASSCACNLLASGGDLSSEGKAACDAWTQAYYGHSVAI